VLQDRTQATVVRSIVSLAQSLRLKVIAEGVETQEQAHVLTSLGVDQLQGYYFGRPLGAREVESRLQTT
jgi:EAL domain-containing protein (putative c-di-GMP-specific phosphodiesterase class I)